MTAALVLFGGLCALVIKECARLHGDFAVEHLFETGRLLDDELVTRDLHACAFGDSKKWRPDQRERPSRRRTTTGAESCAARPPPWSGRPGSRRVWPHRVRAHLAGSVSGCERNEKANSSAGRFCHGMHFICLRCVMQLTSIGVWNERVLPRWTVRWPSA